MVTRRRVWRLASGLLMIFATVSHALAEEGYGTCRSYAIENSDFRSIPAETSICAKVGVRCLSVDPSNETVFSSPISYIDFDRQTTARCAGLILAYTEIRPEDAIDYGKLTRPQERRLVELLPHDVNDAEWDAERTSQHMTFQSETDPDLSAEGLCYTEAMGFTHSAVHDCAIYQFRKSGHVFAISVVGSRPGRCPLVGGEDLYWPRDFLKRAAGQVFGVVANSDFDQNISVTPYGIRSSGWVRGAETLEHQRATIELVIRNAYPAKKYGTSRWHEPSRSFSINAHIKAEQCRQSDSGSWLWIRSSPDVKAEWQKKGRNLIRKIEATLCSAYGFGKLRTWKSFEYDSPIQKGVVRYIFECTNGPRSSSGAP